MRGKIINMPSLYTQMCVQDLSVWECVPGMLSCTREEKHCRVTKKLKHHNNKAITIFTQFWLVPVFFLIPDFSYSVFFSEDRF